MLTNQDSDVDIQLRRRYSQSLKPCELQKLIPNHQSSFCWIYRLLLTLLTLRFSWPLLHNWASQELHFAGLNHISMAGLSRWPGEGRYPQNINWSLGILRGQFLDPLLFSTYTTSLAPIIQTHGFSFHCYSDDTQLYLSFRPDDPTVAARISSCLADISAWMKEHHLQLNLAKTELLVFHATPTLQHDFTIQLGSSTITPSSSVRNLGVLFDDQLTFIDHIAKTARSCRFALHNIRKIRSFLTQHAAQLLVQALVISRLEYCNALLAGLPSCIIKPLQMIQNAAARLVFSEPKRANVTPLFISMHWLPVAARIKFKTLMLAYRTATGSAPAYFHSQSTSSQEAWDLRASVASWCHHREAQNPSPERFHSPFLAGGINPPPNPEYWIPDHFQATPENSSLPSSLDFILIIFFLNTLPSLSLTLLSFP